MAEKGGSGREGRGRGVRGSGDQEDIIIYKPKQREKMGIGF